MTIATNSPILAADLRTVWDPVLDIYAVKAAQYEINTTTLFFDGLIDTWFPIVPDANSNVLPTSPAIAIWVPSTDAQIIGITTIIGSGSETGTATLTLDGNVPSTLSWTATGTSGSQVRTQTTIPTGVYGVLAGDKVTIQITALSGYTGGTALCRVHVVTRSRWTRS